MENGFEVFISFKNTDEKGERTQDSVMAEELYYALKEMGIRAFYSNISITESGEHRFGKMIREAIEESSIFVAVGTCVENFESSWVEYEREAFFNEIMSGNKASARSGMFSYITKNVSTNKLPMELKYRQAFYELKDVVAAICARFQKENEVIQNFKPHKISIESLSPGTLVDGKYKILSEIGRGGMSVVYLAQDMRLGKQWAVKVVKKEGVKDFEVVRQSLLAEVDMLKSFHHPSLPQIIDVIDAKGSFVMIMDYIEGLPLSNCLKEKGAQPEEKVIAWAKQLCDVLHYLHTHNPPVIYRDLKPANIMLKPDDQLTLIDFGTARRYKEKNMADTTCLGTVGYAAPEQYGGMGQTDPRTDIYALGITLFHLVTGKNPAEPPYETYPIRKSNPQLSYGLEAIINKCIQRNPENRYQSAAEVRNDLDNIKKLDAKCRRKGIVKTSVSKILGKKDKPKKTARKKQAAPWTGIPGQGVHQPAPVPSPKFTVHTQPLPPVTPAVPVAPPVVIPGAPVAPVVPVKRPVAPGFAIPGQGVTQPAVPGFAIPGVPVNQPATSPVCADYQKGVTINGVKKSDLQNPDPVRLWDRVAVCVSAKPKANTEDPVNVYFATEAGKGDIVKHLSSNPGYTNVVTGDRVIDIHREDLVRVTLVSETLVFSCNEFEFVWKDHTFRDFYAYFSFPIHRILQAENACFTMQLYVNNEKRIETRVCFA